MNFTETELPGVFVVELDRRTDDRGFFARVWCEKEAAAHGLRGRMVQCNVGFSEQAGTLRGIHFQKAPHAEAKLVRCTRGAAYDVSVDLRPDSPTCGRWIAFEMTPENGKMLYIPEGFGHAYQTLVDDTEFMYLTSQFYAPDSSTGYCHDDPAFGITWPLPVTALSQADREWPPFRVESDSTARKGEPS